MTNKRVIPKFNSEAEEADWWFEHADDFADDILAGIADGTLKRSTVAQRFGLVSNVVEIKPTDAERAREYAATRGIEYEAYVQQLVHEALEHVAKAS